MGQEDAITSLRKVLICAGVVALLIAVFSGWFYYFSIVAIFVWIFCKWMQNRAVKMQCNSNVRVAQAVQEANNNLMDNLQRKRKELENLRHKFPELENFRQGQRKLLK